MIWQIFIVMKAATTTMKIFRKKWYIQKLRRVGKCKKKKKHGWMDGWMVDEGYSEREKGVRYTTHKRVDDDARALGRRRRMKKRWYVVLVTRRETNTFIFRDNNNNTASHK
mmetsp:Transcript_23378/g.34653  ORF Transcript_23378/g.34653 Transcript_23378/m.34653 type:complete len:111 (-) Transcript_23378:115-447(-)